MARLDELPQLYRELRLLRLKYEHLADVCKSLMKNWSVGNMPLAKERMPAWVFATIFSPM